MDGKLLDDRNCIKIRGAKVHNLKNIDVDVPLGKLVAISGVSGSGKSSLALGVIYAEGSRRYLEALSTYTRRRISQHERAVVDSIEHVPATIALHQRPNVPNVRSTFGTMTELLNSLRLIYSRCGNYRCPNGHYMEPNIHTSTDMKLKCPVCDAEFLSLGAEEYAFNSDGACKTCGGTGFIREVDETKIVSNPNKTIEEGAVESWNRFGISWMHLVAKELGVRTNIPFHELTDKEKDIVFHGEAVKKYIVIPSKNGKMFELNALYRNAVKAVEEALKGSTSDKSLEKVSQYLSTTICKDCNGTRINARANSTLFGGINLSTACAMTLDEITKWLPEQIKKLPSDIRKMADAIEVEFMNNARVLLDLGLGYITLDRAGGSLSTGELQRVQLARTVRNRTTGVLYVLDEPSIGLHPSNVDGLIKMIDKLLADGNSVVLVDHDVRILQHADYLIEIGQQAGKQGGNLIACGDVKSIINNKQSVIGKYLAGENILVRRLATKEELFAKGKIAMQTDKIHTVKPLDVAFPKNRLSVITGFSGSGKTTMILDSLYPAMKAKIANLQLPKHIKSIDLGGISRINLIDATPIGDNIRSTVATYSSVLDDLRKLYAGLSDAKQKGFDVSDFSYNTGRLRCQTCNGTGQISMDVQFLPDITTICSSCEGLRYSQEVDNFCISGLSIKDLMALTITETYKKFESLVSAKKICEKLKILIELGLGYLTLGEATTELSGGEAQRLKLAFEIDKNQNNALFIFDEPSIGLHPEDVKVLIRVFQKLLDNGATIITIEHDLDIIHNADYIVDMGPEGGNNGGEIVASGVLEDIKQSKRSITARYL